MQEYAARTFVEETLMSIPFSFRSGATTRVSAYVAAALATFGAGAAAPTQAQEADSLEQVIITGSRIARTEVESSVPVQVVTAEVLESQGSQNIVDVLQELPSFGTAGFSRANSNFAVSGNGVSTLNLRNAGDQRTLVLINGRRAVAGIGGSSSVDVNNIPTALIEGIEIITGGASAVYGSEAVAGVVNFRLKDDFEGFEFRGQSGQTSESDNDRYMGSLTAGFNLGERGNITANLTWDKDVGLRSRNRAISAVDRPTRSGFPPQGRFFADSQWTYDSNNTLINWRGNNVDGFNRNAERYIAVPLERMLLTTLGTYDITDNVELFFEGSYADTKSRSRLEPLATANDDARLPNGDPYAGLTLDNPFIPAAIRAEMIAGGITELSFFKRLNGVFDRSNRNDREFERVVLGVRGTVFEDWTWDVYVNASKTSDFTFSETGLRDRYFFALDAIADPMTGAPICRDATARAAGCQPFNPFGFNSASAGAAAYLTNNGRALDTYRATIEQKVAAANLVGELWELPGGALKIATGIEHRREDSAELFSADTQAGNTLGNALSNTEGDYSVTEAYLEAILPLIESLDLELAGRAGDYTTVGNVFSWKAGLTWAPIDDLRLRGVYSVATRAPNIGELFAGANQTFPPGLVDPCDGIGATTAPAGTSAAVASYCRAQPGFAANIAANMGVFFSDPNFDVQSYQGFDFSNSSLGEETAKTLTVGLVWTPEALPRFQLTLDWFNIEIEDAINLVPRQFIIDQCAQSGGASELCNFITREPANPVRARSPGTLYNIDSEQRNAAVIETAGVDLSAKWAHTLTNGHTFNVGLNYTYLDKLNLQPIAGEPVEANKGELNGDGRLGAGFEHRANLNLGYEIGGFKATWRLNYQSSIVDTLPDTLPIGAYVYNDMQVRYNWGDDDKYGVYFGVDNVFDKKPPLVEQNFASNITGTETAAESYDPIGRFMYVGLEFKF
jgi:iron complex outermembrane receptor protein